MPSLEHVDLNSLRIFAAVAEAGGFTAAAERLGMAKAKVSIHVRRLEKTLGAALFTRTTRRVTLTDAGRLLYRESRPHLQGIEETVNRLQPADGELSGTLRLSATVDHAEQVLAAAVAEFSALHPRLNIELRTSDRITDPVHEGIDIAIRLGWLRDSSLRAVKLGEVEQQIFAAPAYLERSGWPAHPDELAGHDWIALTLLPSPLTWWFTNAEGMQRRVQTSARLRVDSAVALRALLREGAGLSALDEFSARADVESGRLARVLSDWTLPRAGLYAVYPPGRHLPAKVRTFIDFYRQRLQR